MSVEVSMPTEAWNTPPHINWRHIDGPMMSWRGEMHWLSWRERLALWLRRETPESLARKIFPRGRRLY